jgi:hypothetical protein
MVKLAWPRGWGTGWRFRAGGYATPTFDAHPHGKAAQLRCRPRSVAPPAKPPDVPREGRRRPASSFSPSCEMSRTGSGERAEYVTAAALVERSASCAGISVYPNRRHRVARYEREHDQQLRQRSSVPRPGRFHDGPRRGVESYASDVAPRYDRGYAPVSQRQQHSRGWMHAYDRGMRMGYGEPRRSEAQPPRGWVPYGGRDREATGGQPLTGMEGNRHRGVYGSDYRAAGLNRGRHGGYRGEGWNRGGGMNPGRRGPE